MPHGEGKRMRFIAGLMVAVFLAACASSGGRGPRATEHGVTHPEAEAVAPTLSHPGTPESDRAINVAPKLTPPEREFLAAGVHEQQVQVDGHARRWSTVVPPRADGALPTGLVIVLHGVGGRGADMRSAEFEPLAAAQGAVVAYPDAVGGAWNDGRPGVDPVVPSVAVDDDIRFLRIVIEETAARTGADARRVAVVGFSNGAVMAGKVAGELADRVTAVATIGGTAGQGFEQSCRPARPVGVVVVAGSKDRTVPYAGGRVADWGTRRRGFVAPVDEFFAFWSRQAGCSSTQPVAAQPQVSAARGEDCRAGVAVLRYRVNGGGHEWFRPPGLDTTKVVWDFVSGRFAAAA